MARVRSVPHSPTEETTAVRIPANQVILEGDLTIPHNAAGLVLFAHSSGGSRFNPANRFFAATFQRSGCATLLFDLLTKDESTEDASFGHLRFNISLLAERLTLATHWALENPITKGLAIAYFGSSTGATAAMKAAAAFENGIAAVVSRGGRPDLAREALPRLTAATLLIVEKNDDLVLHLSSRIYEDFHCEKDFVTVPGAAHLAEDPATLEEVAQLSARWYKSHFKPSTASSP